MLKNFIVAVTLSGAFVALGAVVDLTGTQAIAQYRSMDCSELWYARNAIYADKGHCFKTRRGRRAFGRNCFPPYGKLNRSERRRVNRIIDWEYRRGCR